jgi:hypothetical protein
MSHRMATPSLERHFRPAFLFSYPGVMKAIDRKSTTATLPEANIKQTASDGMRSCSGCGTEDLDRLLVSPWDASLFRRMPVVSLTVNHRLTAAISPVSNPSLSNSFVIGRF